MKKNGRPRSSTNHPAHIQPEKLPNYVWYNTSGNGKWMLKYYDIDTQKWRSRRICSGKATLSQIWQAYESNNEEKKLTFRTLSVEFQKSNRWQKLALSTKNDYLLCHKQICERKTSEVLLGDIPFSAWTTGTVRSYRDKRETESASRANKELSYMKSLFSWALEYEFIKTNPAKDVRKIKLDSRSHYAKDEDYNYMLEIAKKSNYWYLPFCMELAYLCRMRLCEVFALTDAHELEEGLLIERRKGSKDNITAWTPRLRSAWDSAKEIRDQILEKRKQPMATDETRRFIFISNRTGDVISIDGAKTALARIGKLAEEQAKNENKPFQRFWFHDLKRKGISDTDGDRKKASGHRSEAALNVYDVALDVVKPAGKD